MRSSSMTTVPPTNTWSSSSRVTTVPLAIVVRSGVVRSEVVSSATRSSLGMVVASRRVDRPLGARHDHAPEHGHKGLIGLPADELFVDRGQAAAGHDHPAVDDGGVDTAAVGGKDQ